MDNIKTNIALLLGDLYEIFNDKVSDNIYVGYPPSSLSDSITDFVVVSSGSSIKEENAFARGILNIHLFAKNRANGTINAYLLSEMEKKLQATINDYQGSDGAKYSFNIMAAFSDRDEIRGFTISTYLVNIIVL